MSALKIGLVSEHVKIIASKCGTITAVELINKPNVCVIVGFFAEVGQPNGE